MSTRVSALRTSLSFSQLCHLSASIASFALALLRGSRRRGKKAREERERVSVCVCVCERERQRERDALEAYKSDQLRYPMALAQMQRMQKTITLSVQGLQLDVESARNALGTQDVNMRENPVFQDVNMRENPVFEDVDMRENPVLQDVEMDECHALQDVKMDECPVLEDVEMRDCPVLRDVRNLRLSLGKRTAS